MIGMQCIQSIPSNLHPCAGIKKLQMFGIKLTKVA